MDSHDDGVAPVWRPSIWHAAAADQAAKLIAAFAARMRDAVTLGELALLLDEAARSLGFAYHALVQHADLARPPHRLVFLQNYPPAWVERFARSGLHRHDPAQRLAAMRPGSFAWRDLPRLYGLSAEARRVMEGAERAGLGEGFTVPLHAPGHRSASCSFATLPGRPLPDHALLAAELLAHGVFSAAFDLLLTPRRRAVAQLAPRELECIELMDPGKTD